jgi:urate oxidase
MPKEDRTCDCQKSIEEKDNFQCEHLTDSVRSLKRKKFKYVGFHSGEQTSCPRCSKRPLSWCNECNIEFEAAGQKWTNEVLDFVMPTRVCDECYDKAKEANQNSA